MLPARVRADVQRILDAEARRLLAGELDGDPVGTAAGSNPDLGDDGADQGAAGVERQAIPVPRGADRDDGLRAA